ncbi:uncharacterized protein LOC113351969 [Papaver somniferum]|uniref:uncharacterized protein LOC113351969 n=1 Tax=Papaver somniferum TaxID=3469 RepID=UPI000E6FDE73|nr:uncharacterized protein LOC113351969 [Papaver somniferum]
MTVIDLEPYMVTVAPSRWVSNAGGSPMPICDPVRNLMRQQDLRCNLGTKEKVEYVKSLFQDLFTGATIGLGKDRGGLYYLELQGAKKDDSKELTNQQVHLVPKILLWHKRLRSSISFGYLQRLLPNLFSELVVSKFHYESELAKYHNVPYHLSMNTIYLFFLFFIAMFGLLHEPLLLVVSGGL